jgi:hypothetical protein
VVAGTAGLARGDGLHVETVRARFQTGMHDDAAPAVYGAPARTGLLEGNERFRLQDEENRFALAGDASAYLSTADRTYQLVPNELFADLAPLEGAGLNLGRRKLVYGSGFAYNPTDWLNVAKDPLNPQEQKVGAYLALAEFHRGNYGLTAIYAPRVTENLHRLPTDVDYATYTGLVRAYALVAEGDLNVQGGVVNDKPRAGLSYGRFFDLVEAHVEASVRQGSDTPRLDPRMPGLLQRFAAMGTAATASPLLRGVTVAPFVYPDAESDRWFPQVLAGTRYTTEDNDMLALEYLWNGEGLDSNSWDARIDFLRRVPAAFAGLLSGASAADPSKKFNVRMLRRNYVFASWSRPKLSTASPLLEDLGVQVALTANVDRAPSMLPYAAVSLVRGDHAKVLAGVAAPIGSPTSEYGSLPFREMYVFQTEITF